MLTTKARTVRKETGLIPSGGAGLYVVGCNTNYSLGLGIEDTQAEIPVFTKIGTDEDWVFVSGENKLIMAGKKDGSLWSWGSGADTQNRRVPSVDLKYASFVQMSSSNNNSVAINDKGKLYTRGDNRYYQLGRYLSGNATRDDSWGIVNYVNGDGEWLQADVGVYHTIAINSSGRMYSGGNSSYGQCGNGKKSEGHIMSLVTKEDGYNSDRWRYVSCGDYHSIAINKDGKLFAWGRNRDGSLGIGYAGGDIYIPTEVVGYEDVGGEWEMVTAGGTSCAGIKNGVIYVWGPNTRGVLGLGDTDPRYVPTILRNPDGSYYTDWDYVYMRYHHCFAIRQGKLYAWGDNYGNHLGIADAGEILVPTRVDESEDWRYVFSTAHATFALKGGN